MTATGAGTTSNGKHNIEYCVGSENVIIRSFIACLNFATIAHKDQKRKDEEKTPYINHPIGVCHILTEEADLTNLDLLRGCLLHDTVEDTDVVIEDIFDKFGEYIGNLVRDVTDDKTLPKQMRKDIQVIHAKTLSPQAKVVKIADKLYNLRDLDRSLPVGWSEQRRKEYYEWSLKVCNALRGVCPKLEAKLDKLLMSKALSCEPNPNTEHTAIPHWPEHDELRTLVAAADYAARHHSCHFVFDAKNGEPYINHLVSVAFILSEEAGIQDSTALSAALLCDTVGKSNASVHEIEAVFGKKVGKLVKELTYDHSKSLEDRFQTKMSQATAMSDDVKVIMLASVVDDCRRLESFEPEGWPLGFKAKYVQWARKLIDMLAGSHSSEQQLDNIFVTKMFENMKFSLEKNNKR